MRDTGSVRELLETTRVRVSPETYSLIAVSKAQWDALISDPERSPRMTAPFMILMDQFEVTMLLDETDLATVRPGLGDSRVQRGFRLLTFENVLDFNIVGFIAEVSRILAEAGIPIFPISAFSRDHVLVKQDDLAPALKALGPHVAELC